MRYEPRDLAGRVNCFWNQDILDVDSRVGESAGGDGRLEKGSRLKGIVHTKWNSPGKREIRSKAMRRTVAKVENPRDC
jgi:hypothetical protein